MSYTQIKYEVVDRTATLTLNRPEQMNAFTHPVMSTEIVDALSRADADDDVRAVIFTGAGRAFCAGMDLSAGDRTFDYSDRDTIDTHREPAGVVALRVFDMKKPVIAAINGAAVGVGLTMTLPMDFRIATDTARMGLVFAKRGVVLGSCASWFLPRIVGINRALEWACTGRIFKAEEALKSGLVSEVAPPDRLLPRAREIAAQIAEETSAVSVAVSRRLLWGMLGAENPREAHRVESRLMFWAGLQPDVKEGIASFREKRPARFPMRLSRDLPDFFPQGKTGPRDGE